MFQELWKALDGRKTYLVAGLWAIAVFANSIGWLSVDQMNHIKEVLLPAGLFTLRAAIEGGQK